MLEKPGSGGRSGELVGPGSARAALGSGGSSGDRGRRTSPASCGDAVGSSQSRRPMGGSICGEIGSTGGAIAGAGGPGDVIHDCGGEDVGGTGAKHMLDATAPPPKWGC